MADAPTGSPAGGDQGADEVALEADELERWRQAGVGRRSLPEWAKAFAAAGLTPDHIKRWRSARLDLHPLPSLLPQLNADFSFDDLLEMLTQWMGEHNTEPTRGRGVELLSLLNDGLTVGEVRQRIALGFSGHEVFRWHGTRIPSTDWSVWMAHNLTPERSKAFSDRGVRPDQARAWIDEGLSVRQAFKFVDLGASPTEAAEFSRRRVRPEWLKRTDTGLIEIEQEPDPWEVDPVEQLPEVIAPGGISFVLWSTAAGGDPVAYDVSFGWNGHRSASWYTDISMFGRDLSPLSSSPITGTAAWPNGRDVEMTYDWSELGLEGSDVLVNAAPTVDDPASDDGAKDPRRWIELAEAILYWIFHNL